MTATHCHLLWARVVDCAAKACHRAAIGNEVGEPKVGKNWQDPLVMCLLEKDISALDVLVTHPEAMKSLNGPE